MTGVKASRRRGDATPDSHLFPTRPYDLVREFVIALVVVLGLTLALAAVFSSPDTKAITLSDWAKAAPSDVVATATAELAGTSASASYGAPYNNASTGQQIGPLQLQKLGGVRIAVDSANDLVIIPLSTVAGNSALTSALADWHAATADQQASWANAYATALAAAPDGDPTQVPSGDYGPVPALAASFLTLASSGSLEGLLADSGVQATNQIAFYPANQTKALLLLADGSYLEDQARADHLGGDQWGMMNEAGNYPGQPWMWLYTFWYQVKPFSVSGNADALVWGLMMLLTVGFVFVPFIPGVRSLPRHLGVHRLIWRKQ
jgi:hypothetical protein